MIGLVLYIALGAPIDPAGQLSNCIERKDRACVASLLATPPANATPEYLAVAARGYMLLRRNEEAMKAIDHALELKPEDFGYLMEKGWLYQRGGDQPSAIHAFLLAAQSKPDSPEVFYEIGMSFFFAHEDERAKRHFNRALELDPKSDRAEFMLGIIDIRNEQLPQAESHFHKAMGLRPDSADYLLHHAVLLAKLGQNEMAVAEMRRAEKIDGSNPLTHFNLGKAYRQSSNLSGARAELEIAMRLRPDFSAAAYQLGSVYRQLGEQSKARAAFARFQTLNDAEKSEPEDPIDAEVSQ
jgi:tetratricopeptide (TPR) repeat protein